MSDWYIWWWPPWGNRQRLAFLLLTIVTSGGQPHGGHKHHHGRHKHNYILTPNHTRHIMGTVTVGHKDTFTIRQLDQNGNPMLTPVDYTAPPTWTNTPSDASVDSFTSAADGTSAVLTALAPGSDTVAVTASAVVDGSTVSFSASVLVSIEAAPQTLSSIEIVEKVV